MPRPSPNEASNRADVERHGTKEGFCPRCYDFHPFRIETKEPAGVTGAFCMNCEFPCEPDEIPHGPDGAEERFPDEI